MENSINNANHFYSFLDTGEFRIMNSKSNNVKIMMGVETDDIINELFKSFFEKYQEGLETKMKEGSNFVFESVDLLYYSLHKISLNRGGSNIKSPKRLQNKGATINSKNRDNECFKYAITVSLSHKKLNITQKEYLILSPFLISVVGRG